MARVEFASLAGQRREQRGGVHKPVRATGRGRAPQQPAKPLRSVRSSDTLLDGLVISGTRHPGEEIEQGDPHGVDIAACIGRVAAEQLRRHVSGGAGPRDRRRRGRVWLLDRDEIVQQRQAEVEDLDLTARAQEHVAGLDVAVNDASGMCFHERGGHVSDDRERVPRRHGRRAIESVAEGLALEQLEDEVGSSFERAVVVERDDVGVL